MRLHGGGCGWGQEGGGGGEVGVGGEDTHVLTKNCHPCKEDHRGKFPEQIPGGFPGKQLDLLERH